MATAVLAGSTGLVGSNMLSTLLAHPAFSSVYAYTRRDLPNPSGSTKLQQINSADSSQWKTQYPAAQKPKIFYSALGTTLAKAGSLEAQRKIDYDLALDLAKAAKEAGTETYVLISSGNASSKSYFPYTKMKGELEDAVKELGFKHTVIMQPGLIIGERNERRTAEATLQSVAKGLRSLVASGKLTDWWAQDASVIGRAAVEAGVRCMEGKKEEGVWVVGAGEIMEMGKQ